MNMRVIVDGRDKAIAKGGVNIVGPVVAKWMPIDYVEPAVVKNLPRDFTCVGQEAVIIANEHNEFAACVSKRSFPVLGGRKYIQKQKMLDSRIISLADDSLGLGILAVILDNNLEVLEGLAQCGRECVPKCIGPPKGRDDK